MPDHTQTNPVAEQIEELSPQDGADMLQRLPAQVSADISEYLNPTTAARVLVEMDSRQAATVITDMRAPEAAMVLGAMAPDDRVDILAHVPEPAHSALLAEMTVSEADETRLLEQYPSESAGGLMTPEVTALNEDLTVEQAVSELRRMSRQLEQMFYVYVVDGRRHLVGVLSMRDLILADSQRKLSSIMRPAVYSIPATMDQEEVARRFRRYGFLAMPVVDDRNRLLGIITVDDVVNVIEQEATEDIQKLFGVSAEERLTSPWPFSFSKRVVWLVINLGTAFLAAWVVGLFQNTIKTLTILAAYMPVVAGMGGNASAQAMAVSIRGLALGKVDRKLLAAVFYREAMVGILTGLVVGLITGGVALTFNGSPKLGLVLALALIINHTLACTTGAIIPIALKSLGFDPAQSSTIFATTVTDVAGFLALLGLARVLLV
jgi:magnesium transporter